MDSSGTYYGLYQFSVGTWDSLGGTGLPSNASAATQTSLAELLVQLGLDFKDPNGGNGVGGNPAFALLGHSSALTARKVTTLTPTAFVFTPPPDDGSTPVGMSTAITSRPAMLISFTQVL